MLFWRARSSRPWLCAPLGFIRGLPNGGKNAHVAAAATDQVLKGGSHLLIAGIRIFVEQGFGRQHPAVQTVTALEGLLLDKSSLHGVGIAVGRQPFECDDLFSRSGVCVPGTRTHLEISE